MSNKTYKTLCIATWVFLLLFPLQQFIPIIPVKELSGSFSTIEYPSVSKQSILEGQWQKDIDTYEKQQFGFHEWAIRLYNQIQWSIFHRSTVESVVVGRNNYLYERYVLDDYYESRMYKYTDNPDELLANFDIEASRLSKVQAILEECGVHLFVVSPASKDRIYPEYAPISDTLFRPMGPTAIDNYPLFFERYGVRFLNMTTWMQGLKNNVPYQITPKYGTHWTNICATYAFDSIMRYMEQIGGLDITDVMFTQPYADKYRDPDRDLEKLLNLIFPLKQMQYMYVAVDLGQEKYKPRFIVIGDSFFWNIIFSYPLEKLFDWHYWYYNSTCYAYKQNCKVASLDFVDELLASDYIMLCYSSAQLYDIGNGFITKALIELCYDKETIELCIQSIIQSMRNDSQWYQSLLQKAQEQSRSIEEIMRVDAEYLLYRQPEDFFSELKGQELPSSRCMKVLRKKQSL